MFLLLDITQTHMLNLISQLTSDAIESLSFVNLELPGVCSSASSVCKSGSKNLRIQILDMSEFYWIKILFRSRRYLQLKHFNKILKLQVLELTSFLNK